MGKQPSSGHGREIWAVMLVGLALLLLLSLLSYHPFDVGNAAAGSRQDIHNLIGPAGAWLGYLTFSTWGVGAYVLMVVLAVIGVMLLRGKDVPWRGKAGAGALLLLSSACLLHLMQFERARVALNLPSAGGFVGMFVGDFFTRFLGMAGTAIIFVVAYLVSLIVLINFTPSYWVALSFETAENLWGKLHQQSKPDVRNELAEKEREITIKQYELGRQERKLENAAKPADPKIEDRTQPLSTASEKPVAKKEKPVPAVKPKPEPAPVLIPTPVPSGPYMLPPLELLDLPSPGLRNPAVVEDLKQYAEILRATLEEFGIQVQVTDVTKGPAVTLYELVPSAGVKIEKISALSNNIALAMKAVTVRILTPVPGKGTVGIEVPNSKSTIVFLRDILECELWRKNKALIPIALGRDVAGNPILGDLADMPHLLIAGATGSGKTVCVNAILATLLFRFGPDELRLVLIDPKMVEMAHFNVLPHLIVPVVNEPKKVPLALRWVINEMEKRYRIFAKVGVRNIAGFNARIKKPVPAGPPQDELKIEVPRDDDLIIPEKVPYIVVVVDELADLMHTVPVDVEFGVSRLTALGRAAGIHLIVATQRPSVDVVTGVIKANIPTRIAFQVASKQDSRVILDANGADKLLGKGDMLYLPPGSARPTRAQGVLVRDEEITRIIEFIAARSKPGYEMEITQKLEKSTGSKDDIADEEDEELVEKSIEVIRQSNRASTSMLQRRLGIGYNRAARIMDLLEERGIVGPNKGAEPRDILIDLDVKAPAEP